MHAIVPAAVLEATPLPNAVALLPLSAVAAAASNGGLKLPSSATRLAVTVDGTESEEQIAVLKVRCRLPELSDCFTPFGDARTSHMPVHCSFIIHIGVHRR